MLDVHPPEHGIHGMRDFFIHLLTITVGLLIALGLENAAEAIHHRHDRKEAETLIRDEIAGNRDEIREGEAQFRTEVVGMKGVLHTLEARSQGQPGTLQASALVFHQASMGDSAWRTASSTGVLSYMNYSQVQRFSDAYKEQDQLQAMEEQTLEDYLQLMPMLSQGNGSISPEAAKEALPFVRHTIAHLNGMYFIAVGTLQSYEAALK